MIVGRIIGVLLLVLAAVAFLRDALTWYESGQLALLSGAQFWLGLSPASYYGTQSFLLENIPPLWNPVLVFILGLPAFVVAAVLGVIFWFGSRTPQPKKKPGRVSSRS